MSVKFANRMENIKASEIREILKLTEKPEVVSFAGGLPDPNIFPKEAINKITELIINEDGEKALQYSTTEGYEPLRKQIAERMNRVFKTNLNYGDILITSGSQQGLDLSGKLFLDEGDIVLCESPTYLGAIQAFTAYNPNFIEIPTDDGGMDIIALEEVLQREDKVKCIYVIPDFQNPTGRTWSLKRRVEFMRVVDKYEIPVIEDNPYGELRFDGEILPCLKSYDRKGLVIFLGTFSKTFCPGLRIGWLAADEGLYSQYVMLKQGLDLHTSTFSQRQISKYIELYNFDEHINNIRGVYKTRRDLMLSSIKEYFPENVSYTRPEGGLFCWVEVPYGIDTKKVLEVCIKNQVAYVPGECFFPNSVVKNTFRMNYSNASDENIVLGIRKIGKVLRKYC